MEMHCCSGYNERGALSLNGSLRMPCGAQHWLIQVSHVSICSAGKHVVMGEVNREFRKGVTRAPTAVRIQALHCVKLSNTGSPVR